MQEIGNRVKFTNYFYPRTYINYICMTYIQITKNILINQFYIQKIIRQMRNGSTYANTDAVLKDKLITQMKTQLNGLKQYGHHHLKLLDLVKEQQSKYSLLQDQALRKQNQHRIKSDITRTNISQLRNQADSLKMQIHKYNVSIDEILRQTANIGRIIQNKQDQIASQMALNQNLQKNIDDNVNDNRGLHQEIQSMKQTRNKYESECERLRKLLDQAINQLKSYEKDVRQLQAAYQRNQTILQIAKADKEELTEGVKTRESMVQSTQNKLKSLQKQKNELKDRTNKLQKQIISSQSQYNQISSQLDNSTARNKQLTNKLKSQDKNLRDAQSALQKSKLELEALQNQNSTLTSYHNELNTDIDGYMLKIMDMQKFNEELQKQIKFFIQCDQQAKIRLNRKDAMMRLLDQVLNTLHKSGQEIAHLRLHN